LARNSKTMLNRSGVSGHRNLMTSLLLPSTQLGLVFCQARRKRNILS
jgi:hypothetical protein